MTAAEESSVKTSQEYKWPLNWPHHKNRVDGEIKHVHGHNETNGGQDLHAHGHKKRVDGQCQVGHRHMATGVGDERGDGVSPRRSLLPPPRGDRPHVPGLLLLLHTFE